jgi:hypothetical protein
MMIAKLCQLHATVKAPQLKKLARTLSLFATTIGTPVHRRPPEVLFVSIATAVRAHQGLCVFMKISLNFLTSRSEVNSFMFFVFSNYISLEKASL